MFGFISYPEKLKYVRIITLKEYSDELTSLLHELGIMHVEELKKVPEDELIILRKKLSLADELAKLVKFVEGYVGATKLVEVKGDLNIAELEKEFLNTFHIVKSLKEKLEVIANNINEVKNRLGEYGNLIKYLRLYLSSCGNTYLKNLDFEGDLVFAKLVKIKRDQLNNILTTLNVVRAACVADVSEEEALTNFLGFKEELKKFKELINESKAEVIEVPSLDLMIQDYINELESKTIKLKSTVDGLEVELNRLVNESLELLAKAKVLYELYVERIEKILDSLMSEYSYVVEGWIPEGNHENLINTLYGRFKYIYVEELKSANITPPTKLSNRSPVKYFELITRLYGIPRYGEWDPTTLITYSFLIFFGLMTADAVYGLVLLLILKYVLDRIGFIENPYSEGYLNLKKILLVLGVSATFFGILTNTYAGYSIPYYTPLINVGDPLSFISLALLIGLVHVNLAHFLGVIRAIKASDKATLLSELGLLIAEFTALPYILYYFLKVRLLPISDAYYNILLFTSLIGIMVLVIGRFLSLKSIGLFLWLFDVTGLLGDVFSYTRLAGIGLATYLMARNFNDLALMAANAILTSINIPILNILLSIIAASSIILLTNAINLTFGVIGSFVHSLRLCFVEFLPKFYEGGGREFKPLKVSLKKYVLVGAT
ncbi:MAG: V-type ATPase 116kDa subunit family protein [Sulfolobales archaeon]